MPTKKRKAYPCEECIYWRMTGRPPERFTYLSLEYDVDAAYLLCPSGRPMHTVPTADLALAVDYPPGEHPRSDRARVNERHVGHVSLDKPVLIGRLPLNVPAGGAMLLIDGHHRVARAMRDGVPRLFAFLLTQQESDSVCTDHARHLRRNGRLFRRPGE